MVNDGAERELSTSLKPPNESLASLLVSRRDDFMVTIYQSHGHVVWHESLKFATGSDHLGSTRESGDESQGLTVLTALQECVPMQQNSEWML